MIFKRLADFVIKRHKLIIAVWIVVLFYVFPLVFKINDVVVYQETEVGMENLEAMRAEKIISEDFAGQVSNSTMMIVIQNSNVLSPEARDLAWGIYEDILNDSRLQGISSVNFLYSAIQSYISEVAVSTAPMEYMLYAQSNQTAQIVYGLPSQIVASHLTLLAQLGLTPTPANDSLVRSQVLAQIQIGLGQSGLDAGTIAMAMGYASSFYDAWLITHTTDLVLLDGIVKNVANAYFTAILIPNETREFLLAVTNSFSIQTYSSPDALRIFSLSAIASQTSFNMTFLGEIWTLGPSPGTPSALALARQIILSNSFDDLPSVPSFIVSQFVNTASVDGEANTTMLMVLPMSIGGSSDAAEKDVRIIRELVAARMSTAPAGFAVYVSGDPAMNVDMMDAVNKDTSKIDPVTVLLILLLVGLFFKSLVTPWIPLMTIGMAFLTSTAFIYILGTYVMSIHYSVMTMVLVVMLGAGTDYCIFIMSRYREERIKGASKEDAVRTSVTWAGESIATSGATVMIGFGALMIGEFSLIRSMGMALVLAVGMALLFALTMLPSLLMVVGDKVFWPNTMEREAKRDKERDRRGGGYFRKSARFSLKHRRAIVMAALLISVPATYLFLTLESSYDFTAALPNAESKSGVDALGAGFGKGAMMPTYVIVRFAEPVVVGGNLSANASAALEQYCQRLTNMENVRSVTGPTRPFGEPVNETFLASLPQDQRATYDYVISQSIGLDNQTVMLKVVLQDEPFTTHSIHTIDAIRQMDGQFGQSIFGAGSQVLVGGSTAQMADVSRSVGNDFVTMRIVVLIGIYFVLLLVLGSLLIPLRLIMTVVMNVFWTIAMTMIVFQFASGVPVLWMMPLILFVVAMGLGMDYDIFLTTRIREEVSKGATDEKAITTAVERTGGIITACGLVMGGAFGSMLLSKTSLLQEFGFGLSFAILLDAMIVRIYLVPAIMLMLQKWNWYAPGRLQRVRRDNKTRKD